ncbi:ABC-2 type transport system ATP-binding protein [Flavimobilis soli]|uniref:ABC-2 type transport system ATP-binding protein n=1 Tax=Flavimobilis soli TaxID=442709 RepID=A0A2A9EFF4_9MICO|nr:ATP-binding cassette domain-containing protein [Flavimobilis soli]PFG37654.1 ABC-2 type transport system ATP-binding protein [Flavimobilis soli]
MTPGTPITVRGLTRRFGQVLAVDDLSFDVAPGRVTGFLGPNGAGKTTTLRMILGLARPDAGTATIGGRAYVDIPQPTREVGAVLEASSFHPGRTAIQHLLLFAPAAGATRARCDELLALVGLTDAAERRVGGFSLGMRQRLGLATALLGDPQVLILDEPTNGLDPGGIAWLRSFLRGFAADGRTVLVSSHVLSEVQQSVDDVVVLAHGRMVHASPLSELAALATPAVHVTSPDASGLARLVATHGWAVAPGAPADGSRTSVALLGTTTGVVGAAAHAANLELHELRGETPGLEDVFLSLVGEAPPLQRHAAEPTTAQEGRA